MGNMQNRTAPDGRQPGVHPASDRYLIIPVFLPHMGCPHRCVFCNQQAITRTQSVLPSPEHLQRTVKTFLAYPRKGRKRIQIAFFGGNFLGLAPGCCRRPNGL